MMQVLILQGGVADSVFNMPDEISFRPTLERKLLRGLLSLSSRARLLDMVAMFFIGGPELVCLDLSVSDCLRLSTRVIV